MLWPRPTRLESAMIFYFDGNKPFIRSGRSDRLILSAIELSSANRTNASNWICQFVLIGQHRRSDKPASLARQYVRGMLQQESLTMFLRLKSSRKVSIWRFERAKAFESWELGKQPGS
jgi:hypothetical protein